MKRQALAALAVASLTGGGVARAQPAQAGGPAPSSSPAESSPARRAYLAGVEHFREKRYSDAIAEFNKAYRIDPNPVLVFNMARAFEELKDYGPAVEFYKKYLEMAPQAEDRPQVEATIRTLELLRERARAEARVPLAVTSKPDGARVLVDGQEAGLTPLQVELAPGNHFLTLEKQGYTRASAEVTIEPDTPARREVQLVPMPGGVADAEAPDRTWAWVALGAGGAMLAGGAFFGMQALDKHGEADDLAAGGTAGDADALRSLQDDGSRYALVADGLYAAGAAGVIAGVVMLVTGGEEAP